MALGEHIQMQVMGSAHGPADTGSCWMVQTSPAPVALRPKLPDRIDGDAIGKWFKDRRVTGLNVTANNVGWPDHGLL